MILLEGTTESMKIHCIPVAITFNIDTEMNNQLINNRPFSYSEKESQSNDTLLHFVEFSNVHNSDRSPNATRSNLVYKNV